MVSKTYELDNDESTSFVKIIIILNVFVFVTQKLTEHGITDILALNYRGLIQVWRWITYMFCHGNLTHLLFNMWSLFIFGPAVEQALGRKRFVKLYLVSGVIGAACWMIFNIGSPYRLVGASGAIFGVMAAAALLFPDDEIMMIFPPMALKIKTLVICLAILTIIMLSDHGSNVAHLAHLGGLAGGFLFTRRNLRPVTRKTSNQQVEQTRINLHECVICGVSDEDDKDLDFRVCSKCTDGREYCMTHLRDHDHK